MPDLKQKLKEEKEKLLQEYRDKLKKVNSKYKIDEKKMLKKEISSLITLIQYLEKFEGNINILKSENHSLLAGFLTSNISNEDREKYIKIGKEIINELNQEKLKEKEKRNIERKKRKIQENKDEFNE